MACRSTGLSPLTQTDSVEQPPTLRQTLKALVRDGLGMGLQTPDQLPVARRHISTELLPVCVAGDQQLLRALFHPHKFLP